MKTSRWAFLGLLCGVAFGLPSSGAWASGFELGENTAKAVARGGTGVALKRDPSALYFNPALLAKTRGFQFTLQGNLVDLNVEFARLPLTYTDGNEQITRQFDPVTNDSGPFPAPFLAMSWDFGVEDFALGLGLFGPPAYSGLCYGKKEGGECALRRFPQGLTQDGARDPNGARHMALATDLFEVYALLGAGKSFEVGRGTLSLGLSAGVVYQDNTLSLSVDTNPDPSGPWRENPEFEATFEAASLKDTQPVAFFGLAYEQGGVHVAASYRPPLEFDAKGEANVEFSPEFAPLVSLPDKSLRLQVNQAGSLRLGVAWTQGAHPRDARKPRLELEANLVWEDWSRVEAFGVRPEGDLLISGSPRSLGTILQEKSWQDTYSVRLGGGWGLNRWVSLHAGGYLETAAQAIAYTSADFIAWERYSVGAGVTGHLTDWLDLDLGYSVIFMPSRQVSEGKVFQAIPLSDCAPPAYTQASCPAPGRPPGNPQNEGRWEAWAQIASVGVTLHFEGPR